MSHTLTWQHSPAAIALFETAYADYAASDGAHWEFPAAIEADLNDICDLAYLEDGECVISAWHQYCTAREADEAAVPDWVALDDPEEEADRQFLEMIGTPEGLAWAMGL